MTGGGPKSKSVHEEPLYYFQNSQTLGKSSVSAFTEPGPTNTRSSILPYAMMMAYEPDHVVAFQNKDNSSGHRRRGSPPHTTEKKEESHF